VVTDGEYVTSLKYCTSVMSQTGCKIYQSGIRENLLVIVDSKCI